MDFAQVLRKEGISMKWKRVMSMVLSASILSGMATPITTALPEEKATNSVTGISTNVIPLEAWFTSPAANSTEGWEQQASQLGNGYMGAMVFGGVANEKIQVNEKTVWSGGPGADPNFNYGIQTDSAEAKAALNELREILQKHAITFSETKQAYVDASGKVITGNYSYGEDADRIAELREYLYGDRSTYGSYQTLGDIYLTDPSGFDYYTDYKRSLDLHRGVVTITYKQSGTTFKREYFMSYPNNMMVMKLTADAPGKLNRDISIDSVQPQKTITGDLKNNTITMVGRPSDHNENGEIFAQQLKIMATGGSTVTIGGKSCVRDADEIIIFMTAGTNYNLRYKESDPVFLEEHPLDAVEARIANAVKLGYDELLKQHLADYQDLFGNVELNFGVSEMPDKPTDQLLACYGGRTDTPNTPAEDRYLEMLYYQFGRYLLIASSRAGSLPANLQGVWANTLSTPWSGDYHANINIQMNYWLAQTTNLSECHIPMIDYVNSLVFKGKDMAEYYYATPEGEEVRGWAVSVGCNAWNHIASNDSEIGFVPTAAAWMCQDIWEYYQFTLDKQFLQDNFDVMLGAALFWVDNLWTDERDGKLVVNPSYSPEHGILSLGTTFDQAVVWEIFNEVIQAAEVLGITKSEIQEIKDAQAQLAGPQIGLGGQFMEWKDETTQDITGDGGHRHVNHLFPLHPGNQIVAGRSEQEDAYVEAMKQTLETRGDGGTGWSKAWKVNFWARLRDGDHAHTMVSQLLKESTASNLFDLHPPFQIDGNFGGTAGMTEMLLQSQGDAIELLAAMPQAWDHGSVEGIKARGNVEVDMEWNHATLTKAVLHPAANADLKVKGTDISTATLKTLDGEDVEFTVVDQDCIVFAAKAGESYVFDGMANPEDLINAKEDLEKEIATAEALLATKTSENPLYNEALNASLQDAIDSAEKVLTSDSTDVFAYYAEIEGLQKACTTFEDGYSLDLSLSVPSGIYSGNQLVKIITKNPLIDIRYTLDGTAPTATSTLYNDSLLLPFGISDLRAAAFFNSEPIGDVLSAKYMVTPQKSYGTGGTATDESGKTIDGYPVSRIIDGNIESRWATTQNGTLVSTVEFKTESTFNAFTYEEFASDDQTHRTNSYTLEYWDGSKWVMAVETSKLPSSAQLVQRHVLSFKKNHAYMTSVFDPITTKKVRISSNGNQISIWEVGFYNLNDKGDTAPLKGLVDHCKELDLTKYINTDQFTLALAMAESLVANTSASYADVVDAYNGLAEAKGGLKELPGVLPGDVDGNGEVTAADALMALQSATKKITLNNEQSKAADVDGTEGVSANDALMILQAATKKITLGSSNEDPDKPDNPDKPDEPTPPEIPVATTTKQELLDEMNTYVEVGKYTDLSVLGYANIMAECELICSLTDATPLHYQMGLAALEDAKNALVLKPQDNWIGSFTGMGTTFTTLSGGNILYADWISIDQGTVDLSQYGDMSDLRLQFSVTFNHADPNVDPADIWDSFHFKLRSPDTGKENNLGWSVTSGQHKGESVVNVSVALNSPAQHVSNTIDWSQIQRMILYCYEKEPYKNTAESAALCTMTLSIPRIVNVVPVREAQANLKELLKATVNTTGAAAADVEAYNTLVNNANGLVDASVDVIDLYDVQKATTELQAAIDKLQ